MLTRNARINCWQIGVIMSRIWKYLSYRSWSWQVETRKNLQKKYTNKQCHLHLLACDYLQAMMDMRERNLRGWELEAKCSCLCFQLQKGCSPLYKIGEIWINDDLHQLKEYLSTSPLQSEEKNWGKREQQGDAAGAVWLFGDCMVVKKVALVIYLA